MKMFVNYLKTAWRNLLRNRSFSFINILGLSVSMAVCLLIIMIIADQRGFDRFHTKRDRIYRVLSTGRDGNDMVMASSALPLGDLLRHGYSGVEATASLVRNIGGDVYYNDRVASGGGYFADANLFKVFDFTLAQGDPMKALEKPFSLVISQEMADLLFPHEDPMGRTVKFKDTGINPGGPESGNKETEYGLFTITGILRPNPGKTHLPFKLLASLNTVKALADQKIQTFLSYPPEDWNNVWTNFTYVLMEQGRSREDLQKMLDGISARKYPKGSFNLISFKAEPLTSITPGPAIGNMTAMSLPSVVLWVLLVLCLIVMLSACLNYTNLAVARSLTRLKEVGVRKVSGATRGQVFAQFITESVLLSFVSLLVSFLLLALLQPAFTGLWLNRYLDIRFEFTPGLLATFVAFSLGVGVVAGLLPAIYLSAFNPIQMLRNLSGVRIFKHLTLRRMLLVVQFTVSLVFIVSATLIYRQTEHLFHFDYGFDKENVVNIKLFKTDNYDRFAHAVAQNKDVEAVSACAYLPASGTNNGFLVKLVERPQDSLQVTHIDIDAGCLKVWGLKLIAGHNLPAESAVSGEAYVLINENMAAGLRFANPAAAVGSHVNIGGTGVEIVGVVKDFQFLDVSRPMGPLMLRNRKPEFGYATVRIKGHNTAATLAALKASWKEVNPETKFEYDFFDQQVMFTQALLGDAARILGLLAILAVLISCLGLLGMANYTAETRRKEIGIRMVLGSNMGGILYLLSRGFLFMMAIAVVIGTPMAILVNGFWLNFFASRVSIGPGVLGIGIGALLAISLLTVLSQAWRVARASPIRYLRSE